MALILKKLVNWMPYDLIGPNSQEYFLLPPPLDVLVIMGLYLHFVFISGPQLMKNKKAFELKNVLKAYNASQILINTVLFIMVTRELLRLKSWSCLPIDYSLNPQAVYHSRFCFYFYILKIYDTLDTVFFILRKSSRQITFLHVYHHCGMCLATYIALAYFPGGEILWTGTINVFVHAFMFTYYFFTVDNKELRNNIFLKKLLTQLQILQFLLNILIYGRLVFHPDCNFSKIVSYLYVVQNLFMITLFGEFYVKNYILKKKEIGKTQVRTCPKIGLE